MKAPGAFRTISEVAQELDLPQHVLRFWETRFNQIKPMKRGGGRRYYRPEDVDLLRGIRLLLYGEGFTIRGVQRLLKEKGVGFVVSAGQAGSVQTVTPAGARSGSTAVPAPFDDPEPGDLGDEAAPGDPIERVERSAPLAPSPRPQEPLRPAAPRLSEQARRRLQAALSELSEAKRLLGEAADRPR